MESETSSLDRLNSIIRERVSDQVKQDKTSLKQAIDAAFKQHPVDRNYEMLYMLPEGSKGLIVRDMDDALQSQSLEIQKGLNLLMDHFTRLRSAYLFEKYTEQMLFSIEETNT